MTAIPSFCELSPRFVLSTLARLHNYVRATGFQGHIRKRKARKDGVHNAATGACLAFDSDANRWTLLVNGNDGVTVQYSSVNNEWRGVPWNEDLMTLYAMDGKHWKLDQSEQQDSVLLTFKGGTSICPAHFCDHQP